VDLNNFAPPPPDGLDRLHVATWLGPAAPGAAGAHALVVTGIAVLSAPAPGVRGPLGHRRGGNGAPAYPGVAPQLLLKCLLPPTGLSRCPWTSRRRWAHRPWS